MKRWVYVFIIVFITSVVAGVYLYLSTAFSGAFLTLKEMCFLDTATIAQPFCNREVVGKVLNRLNELKVYEKSVKSGELKYIGAPSYIVSNRKYKAIAKKSNPYLKEMFLPLYKAIQEHITDRIGKECYLPGLDEMYQDRIALPGFHIFPHSKYLSSGWRVASVHVDLQYKKIPWPEDKEFDEKKTISFTLALSVPQGAGIYFFDTTKDQIRYRFPRYRTFNQYHSQKIAYQPGWMYLHDGHHFHMISEFNSDDTDRLTLQGHGIYCKTDKRYWLYW